MLQSAGLGRMEKMPGMFNRIVARLARRLMARREADVVIRAPYLYRWHVTPKNRFVNVYLHRYHASDPGPELHDHPWHSLSYMIDGELREETPRGIVARRAGDFVFRRAAQMHRVHLVGAHATTLFITGPKFRDWGFMTDRGWVHWSEYLGPLQPDRSSRCSK